MLPGWHFDISESRQLTYKWWELPKEAKNYIEFIEKRLGVSISFISTSALFYMSDIQKEKRVKT
jgi:adenylosuccinate synthase